MNIAVGSTSKSITVQIVDDAGLPVTGLNAATFPATKYRKAGAAAEVAISLVDLSTPTSAWTSGGVIASSAGYYRLDLPDAAISTATILTVFGEASGKHLVSAPIDVGASSLTPITPIIANVTNPRYATRDLPAIWQGSQSTEVFIIVDGAGNPVDLSGKAIRFVVVNVADLGDDEDSRVDDTLTGVFQYDSPVEIVTGGADSNQLTIQHDAAKTSIPGAYRYFLWNVTDLVPLASGTLTIEPALTSVV
jgi:hypothetical protein